MKAAIIGSGVAGLATAIRLASKGIEVSLFEQNGIPGGKISQIKEGGYRFDTGPSLFTLPNLVTELTPLEYVRLESSCRYFYPDGTIFNFYQDPVKLKQETIEKGIEDFESLEKRFNHAGELYELTAPLFIFGPFHKIKTFFEPRHRKIPLKLHKLGFLKTMHAANRSHFKDKRLVQLFDRYATYNGSSPYLAPSTLNMISHLEHNVGAFFPVKGMYSIVESLYKTAVEKGVKFYFNSMVTLIARDIKAKKADGIFVNGEYREFDIIVSDADVKYLSDNVMKGKNFHPLRNRLTQSEPSSSALIFYWGINREFPDLDIHNILFSNNYKEEFNHLFHKMDLFQNPTVYIFISSKVVKSDAPEGCENWFVMVNAPANVGQDWSSIIKKTRENIINRVNSELRKLNGEQFNIEDHIKIEHIASPVTIEKNTLSSRGSLYGTSSNSTMSAFLRHPNSLSKIKNMWFVGGSVHPGGGIPLCLASAKIVDEQISLPANN